jgi:hypothetical protein
MVSNYQKSDTELGTVMGCSASRQQVDRAKSWERGDRPGNAFHLSWCGVFCRDSVLSWAAEVDEVDANTVRQKKVLAWCLSRLPEDLEEVVLSGLSRCDAHRLLDFLGAASYQAL